MQPYKEHSYAAFLFSALLHLSMAYLFFFGFPESFYKKQLPLAPQPIIFEMLPVKDFINAPNQQKQQIAENKEEATKIVENKQPEKAVETPVQTKPVVEKPEISPEAEELAAEKPVVKETVEKVILEEKKSEEIIPLKEEPPKPKEVEKKIIAPLKPVVKETKKVPVVSDLDSLLKNLEKSSNKQAKPAKVDKAAKGDHKKDIIDSLFDEQQELSVTENSIIKMQIEKNWHPPLGGKNARQIKVTYYIEFNSDGSVRLARLKNKDCGGASASLCNAFVESAERAIWQASPIENLPPERYSIWQNLDFHFDLNALSK